MKVGSYFPDKKSIIIKTYAFESGLWYLAESLINALEASGHTVYIFPKAKFSKDLDSIYLRTYPQPKEIEYFKKYKILPVSSDKLINEQIGNYIVKYNIDCIISFETLMQKSGWIANIKSRFKHLKVIDIPMPEWVDKKYVENKSYNLFDDIWCINDLTFDIFKDYEHRKKIEWDIVDKSIFNKYGRKKSKTEFNAIHLASLNKDFSSKNTALVIKAFSKFIEENAEDGIFITLNILNANPNKYLKSNNMKNKILSKTNKECFGYINFTESPVSRNELSKIYKSSYLLLATSEKEGLCLPLYEAHAAGCNVLTTDCKPMNTSPAKFLTKVSSFSSDGSFVPKAKLDELDLYLKIKSAYEEFKK